MTTEISPSLLAQLTVMHTKLDQIYGMLASPKENRECYTVEEVATTLSRTPYTVREWCREGRINATKRQERRGGAELWNISTAEVARIRNEGLLAPDRFRNTG
ncbi:MAG: hypothetical protein JWN86_469 [Planctomycetota bacterium]|nr:hypothetical protein [Planctomycetota bacterium]